MSASKSHSAIAIVSRPTRLTRAAVGGIFWTVLAPVAFVAIGKALGPTGPPPLVGLWLLAVALPGPIAATLLARKGTGPTRARVVNRSLLLGDVAGERAIPREAIASAYVSPGAKGRERLDVELEDGERLELDYPEGEASNALEALARDPSRHATRIPVYRAGTRVVHSVSGIFLGLFAWIMLGSVVHDISPRGFFSTALGALIALVTTLPFMMGGYALMHNALHHVVVGADGIEYSFASWRGKQRRLLSFADITHVTTETTGIGRAALSRVVVSMESGEKVTIASFHGETAPREEQTIRAAIDAARLRYARADGPRALAALEPGGKGTWLDELRELARSEGSYRGPAVSRERLLEIVDDPRAPARHRLAAAFVLKERNDDEGIDRVRVAAETTASPRVRVALESIAEGRADEADLTSAAEEEARSESAEARTSTS